MQDIAVDATNSRPLSAAAFDASAPLRRTMVERQIRTYDVSDAALIESLLNVPRELFVDPELAELAYSDANLTATGDETRRLTVPLTLARLLKDARPRAGDNVLVVAGAAGYTAALIAGLAGKVTSLESDATLADKAKNNFATLGLANASSLAGPLPAGAPQEGPFDLIVVDGLVEGGLDQLLAQLKDGGRLATIMAAAPDARVGKATLFTCIGDQSSPRILGDAAGATLEAFRKTVQFVF